MNDDALVRMLQRAAKEEDDPRLAELLRPPPPARRERMVAAIVGKKRSLLPRAAMLAAPLAIAAAALVVFLMPSRDVPAYELSLAGDVQEHRAQPAPGREVRLHAGAPFELVARPAKRLDRPIVPRAALVHEGRVQPWSPPLEVDPGGSVRIAGDPRIIFPGAGAYEIVLVLSHDPPGDAELSAIARGEPTRLRVLRGSVRLE
jgi:hypothetical protein